jgi:hypothetical protein
MNGTPTSRPYASDILSYLLAFQAAASCKYFWSTLTLIKSRTAASSHSTQAHPYMNLLANPIKPEPPLDPPPISLFIYIFNAISPACCTALSLDSPSATFPLEA